MVSAMVEESRKLTPEEKIEIIDHMNSDHADAVLLYLHHYAGLPGSIKGVLDEVTETEITITATIQENEGKTSRNDIVKVPLLRRVNNIKEAEHVMVEMFFEAKRLLQD